MENTRTNLENPVSNKQPTKKRVVLAAILFITLMVAYLDRVNVSVLLADPKFIAEMGLKTNPAAQGLLMSLFLFAYGFGNMLLGPVGDWMGPRKAMCLSIFSWGIAMVVGGLTKTINGLFVSRVVLGLGEAMHWPMQSTFVKYWFPVKERGKANSAWVVGLMVAPAVAMPLFTAIVGEYGWRASFWLCAILGLLILPLIWFLTTDKPDQHKGVNEAELNHILEGQREEREKEALTQAIGKGAFWNNFKLLLKNGSYWINAISYWGSATMWWGTMAWLPQYLKVARGFTWAQMGMLSALPYVLGAISVVLVGFVSDRFVRRAPFSAIGIAGCTLFLYIGAAVQDNMISAYAIAVSMFFLGINIPMNWAIAQSVVPSNLIGTAAGLHNGMSQFVAALAPVMIGYLIGITGSYMGGLMYMVGFGVAGSLCSFALVFRKL